MKVGIESILVIILTFSASLFAEKGTTIPITISSNCLNEVLHFKPTIDSKQIVSCYWDFGDASFSADLSPYHAYENTGEYTVNLSVIYTDGTQQNQEYQILVKPFPYASIKHQVICDGPTFFTDNSHSPYPIKKRIWMNNTDTLSKEIYFKENLLSGRHDITLKIEDINGCKDFNNFQININPIPEIELSHKELCANSDNEIEIDFGIEQSLIETKAVKINSIEVHENELSNIRFKKAGSVPIEIFVRDRNGCSDELKDTISILNNQPSYINIEEKNGCSPFNLLAQTRNDADISSSEWILNGELIASSERINTEIIKPGEYKLKSTVMLKNGCSNISHEIDLTVYPNDAINSVVKKEIINNKAFCSIYSSDKNKEKIVDWGDGTINNYTTSASHQYETNGSFLIINKAINDWGCEDSIIHHVSFEKTQKIIVTNVVSPNGDGINDEFEILNSMKERVQLKIYDSTGRLLIQTNNRKWNTLIGNQRAPSGIYFYELSSDEDDFFQYKGQFVIQN